MSGCLDLSLVMAALIWTLTGFKAEQVIWPQNLLRVFSILLLTGHHMVLRVLPHRLCHRLTVHKISAVIADRAKSMERIAVHKAPLQLAMH